MGDVAREVEGIEIADGDRAYDGSSSTHLEKVARLTAVIVAGTSHPAAPPGLDFGARVAAAFGDKYSDRGYKSEPDA